MPQQFISFKNPYATDPATYGLTRTQSKEGYTRYADAQGNYYTPTGGGFQLDTSISPGSLGVGTAIPPTGQQVATAPTSTLVTPSASQIPVSQITAENIIPLIESATGLSWTDAYKRLQAAVPGFPGFGSNEVGKALLASQVVAMGGLQAVQKQLGISVPSGGGSDLNSQVKDYLDQLRNQGYILNPNVQITPEKAAEFLAQAHNEIDPYYSDQLRVARGELLRSAGYAENEILLKEQDYARQYGIDLRQLGEQSAEQGFALSGLRQRSERELAEGTQRDIEAGRRQLSFNVGTAAGQFAGSYGSSNLPSLDIPQSPRVVPGVSSFDTTDTTRLPLYSLSDSIYSGLTGSEEYQRRADVLRRQSELEYGYRLGTSTPSPRTISL